MVRFRGTLTPEIYARGLRATSGRLRWFACALAIAGLIGLASAHIERPATWGWALFLVLLGIMLLRTPQTMVKRAFATDPFLREPFSGEADEQGMRIESEHGCSDLPWALMQKVVLLPDMVIVYQSASLFRILPREFFDDDASWETFRKMANVPGSVNGPPKSVLRMALLWAVIIVIVMIAWLIVNRG